ncbi:MAG: ADP-glyceromanno-heptose 6-epimerase, partial [Candidatus Hydrogenedentota bacterium]
HKSHFFDELKKFNPKNFDAIFHLGACSSTTETDFDYLWNNNVEFSMRLAEYAMENKIRYIYASSAATYGAMEQGFSDDENQLTNLKPINRYGYSKHKFDLMLLKKGWLKETVGLKFFNVYGPNEYHKGDMRSMIHKAFGQIRETGKIKLFKSYRKEFADGEQKRDFIYVKDCAEVMLWLLENSQVHGIFNLGTGQARSWNDLAKAVFTSMNRPVQIEYIEMPKNIRNAYQYFTQANMDKLRNAGYTQAFTSLEEGVQDYVKNYLEKDGYLV